MRDSNLTVRNYIIYIIFVFFSFSLMVLDFFSNQEISTTISKRINFLVPSDVNFNEYFEFFNSDLFQTRNNLINENVRLKNEILELRELRVENDLLKEELKSNLNLIELDLSIKFSKIIQKLFLYMIVNFRCLQLINLEMSI